MPRRVFIVSINPPGSGNKPVDLYYDYMFIKSIDLANSNPEPQLVFIEIDDDLDNPLAFWVSRILLSNVVEGNIESTHKKFAMSARSENGTIKVYSKGLHISDKDEAVIKQCIEQCESLLSSAEIKQHIGLTEDFTYAGWNGKNATDNLPNGIKRNLITLDAGKETFSIITEIAKSFRVFSYSVASWVNAVGYVEKSIDEGKKITRVIDLASRIGCPNLSNGLAPWILNNYCYFHIPVTEPEYQEIMDIVAELKQKQMVANLTKAAEIVDK